MTVSEELKLCRREHGAVTIELDHFLCCKDIP